MLTTHHVLSALALSVLSATVRAQGYSFTVLETLGGTNCQALAVNNLGHVVGSSAVPGNASNHPVRWNGTTATDLGTLGGAFGWASSINDAGQIAGTTHTWAGFLHATYWSGTTRVDLGMVDNPSGTGATSNASGIDALGRVVGSGQTADYYQHATMWKKPDEMKDVANGGIIVDSHAEAINTSGQIVGWSNPFEAQTPRHATLWSAPSYAKTNLGTLGGANSSALDVNESGIVVGNAQPTGSTNYHAALWNGATPAVDLGTLGGANSYAEAINASGAVVGRSQTLGSSAYRATLWTAGVAIDLNTFLDPTSVQAGWVLVGATDVNDVGTIVGSATNSITGETRAFRFDPTLVTSGAFVDVGFGAPGFGGVPRLAGSGSLVGGTLTKVELTFAAPNAPVFLMLSDTSIPTPFLDGTLIAFPYASFLFVYTDGTGRVSLQKTWPVGLSGGGTLWFQCLVGDAASAFGISQSNALRADLP